MWDKKSIAILGATGSIGTQTLEVIQSFPGHYDVKVLTTHRNVDLLARQVQRFDPQKVVVADASREDRLKSLLANHPVEKTA